MGDPKGLFPDFIYCIAIMKGVGPVKLGRVKSEDVCGPPFPETIVGSENTVQMADVIEFLPDYDRPDVINVLMPVAPPPSGPVDASMDKVVEAAELAFWEVVAKMTPSAVFGDFPFDADVDFRQACRDAIGVWREANAAPGSPGVTVKCPSCDEDDDITIKRGTKYEGDYFCMTCEHEFRVGDDKNIYGEIVSIRSNGFGGHAVADVEWKCVPNNLRGSNINSSRWAIAGDTWPPGKAPAAGDPVRTFPDDQFVYFDKGVTRG